VFSRERLLQDVWGYDFFGDSGTIDVHVRRLRAKLNDDSQNPDL
jgi:DNA-binding response OmpR family regulator